MPPSLRQVLAQSDLVINKGDANYRCLVGDCHWPYTTPFADIVAYFPAPLLALRTLKAELAVGLMLSLARRIPEADRSMKEGRWEKARFRGSELSGKVLGLIGSGRIGSEVARICAAFGMRVIAFDPYLPEEAASERGIQLTTLEDVLRRSDFVSIHAALTEETRHMISLPQLRMMKKTACLINCARGAILDEEALVRALRDGLIAGAGLDVYEREPPSDSPLLRMDNVVLTPHIGASTEEAQRKTGLLTVEQVVKAVIGQQPEFLVNKEVLST
jgi:D-3-phosphoglycerate dehydrogenase